MSDIIYYKNGEETFRISPPTVGTKCPETKLEVKKMTDPDIIKECRQTGRTRTTTEYLLEKAYYEQMTEKEQLKVQIQELQEQLQKLEEKSPVEEAYCAVYGWYPPTTSSVSNYEDNRWRDFQNGYNASKVSETPQEPEELKTLYDVLRELDKPMFTDDVCSAVKRWMSQYADNVMCGEYKKGYEYCLTVLEENLKND